MSSCIASLAMAESGAPPMPAGAPQTTPAGARVPPPLDAYGDLPGVETMAISPNGKLLAVISRIGTERRVIVFDRAAKSVTMHFPVGDTKLRAIDWAGDGMVLVTTSATVSLGPGFAADKYELDGVLIAPLNGGKPRMVFDRAPAIGHTTRGHYGTRLINQHVMGFYGGIPLNVNGTSTTVTSGKPALYQVDLAPDAPKMIARAAADDHDRDWLVDANGVVAATLDLSTKNGRWSIVNAGGKPIATGTSLLGRVSLLFFGKDGTTAIYLTEDTASGVTRWYEAPLAGGGDPKEVFADDVIERSFVDSTNGRLIGYLDRGAPPVPHFFDQARQTAMTKVLRAFPKLDVELVDWTPDFAKLLVHTSGSGDSGTWYVVDVAAKSAEAAGYDRLAIGPDMVGAISTVQYKAGDGLAMDGILTLPPRRDPHELPVVMLPHGGPTAADKAEFDWWAQAFASRGYAVFQPNFRGSTNRDDAFRHAGDGQWGRKMQTDISDGLDALAKRGIVDPKRACIVGASYGGYAALAGVTLQHGLYRCAVADAPVVDLDMMYNTDLQDSGNNPMTSRALRATLGAPGTFAAVSPRRHAAQADAPILLIHGKDDTVVPFHQSEVMADALRDAHKPVELVVMKQEDHWLSRAATRKQMLNAAVAFVEKYNPPD